MASFDADEVTGRWPLSRLPANVRVGSGGFIERLASFERFRSEQDPGLTIGDRVFIYMWTAFSVEPSGVVHIGNDSVVVGCQFMCAKEIVIGSRTIISYSAIIADSDFHPVDSETRRLDAIANAPDAIDVFRPRIESAPVHIGNDVRIDVGAIILKGVRIGDGARVGPGSVVTGNVRAGAVVAGNPAREITL